MTTIITRLFKDTAGAQAAANDLLDRGHSDSTIEVISGGSSASLTDRIRAARVNARSTAVYAPLVAKGHALLVVRAPFNPMGAARDAMRTLDRHATVAVEGVDANDYIREEPRTDVRDNLYQGTVFFMSNPHRPLGHGHVLGQNPILPSRPRTSAIAGGAYMSTKFWPMKLISTARERRSVTDGAWHFSSIFGIPTLIKDLPSREMVKTTI
ncbi:MAG: hypothetical protein NTW20_02820 [Rhodobacterales bacterium]|nr:hypothetical protein [Rhodobacterales bacterium]